MMAFQTSGQTSDYAPGARSPRFAAEPRQKSAGRRGWAATSMMVAGTLAIALASYSLSLRVSAERAEAAKLSRQNAALERDLKALDAELRVRMRLPQLQRWNDEVLALKPITAQQYLGNPVQLAAYGVQPEAPAPRLQLTLRTDVATRPGAPAPSQALTAAILPRDAVASPSRQTPSAQTRVVASAPARKAEPVAMDPALVAAIEAMAAREGAAADAPVDLLRQVDMPAPPVGGN